MVDSRPETPTSLLGSQTEILNSAFEFAYNWFVRLTVISFDI